MAEIYELNYKREEGRYEPVDITAVLKKLEQGEYVEIDYSDVEFKPDVEELLSIEVRDEGNYQIAKVDVLKEALDRDDFDERIRNPVRVEVTAKPPAEAGKPPPADVKAECEVRIGPAPSVVKVLHPTPEELPWPAKPEQKMPVELQLFRGSESKPLVNTVVNLERKNPSDPPCGEWDADAGPPKKTDEQGRVDFTFVPNELYYKPGGKYYEEYTVWTGEGEGRREIGSFKFSVGPRVKFRMEIEKKATFNVGEAEREFAVVYEEEAEPVELELGPSLKIDALQIVPELPDDGKDSATRLPVAFAKVKTVFLDKEGAETPAPGETPETDDKGLCTCKLPELTEAFTGPTTYDLREHKQNPVGKLNEGAEATIQGYRTRVESHTPKELLDGTLFNDLLEYRKTFCAQMAAQQKEKYQTVESAAELLCSVSTHTKLFNNMYNDQWGRLGGVFGDILTDVLAMAINLKGVGDTCVDDILPNVPTYFKGVIDKIASWGWVRKLIAKVTPVLVRIRGLLDDVIGFLRTHIKGTLDSLLENIAQGFRQFGGDLDELVSTSVAPDATGREVAEALRDWAVRFLKLVFRAIGRLFMLLADIVVGLFTVMIKLISGLCSAVFDALPARLQTWIVETLPLGADRIKDALKVSFTSGSEGYGALSLSKLIEVLIGWLNDKIGLTAGAGDMSGQTVVKNLCLMDWMADPVLQYSKGNAENLKVSAERKPVQDGFREFIVGLRDFKCKDEKFQADVDKWATYIDTGILCIELIIMLVITIFSLGGAAVLGGIFTKVEIAVGAVKLAFVRLPQAVWTVVLAFFILIMYVAGTMKVTYSGASA